MLYTLAPAQQARGRIGMAWKTMDVHEQRVRFVVEAVQATKSFRALCAA